MMKKALKQSELWPKYLGWTRDICTFYRNGAHREHLARIFKGQAFARELDLPRGVSFSRYATRLFSGSRNMFESADLD